jgi:hypothetical protein
MRKVESKKARCFVLSDKLFAKAKAIGRGNFAKGVRKALEEFDSAVTLEQFEADQASLRSDLLDAVGESRVNNKRKHGAIRLNFGKR